MGWDRARGGETVLPEPTGALVISYVAAGYGLRVEIRCYAGTSLKLTL
jgi:hypothetical protein